MADEYTRGEMDISHHQDTARGVLDISVYSVLLIAVTIIFLTLVFGTAMGWVVSLGISVVIGGAGGFVMKQGSLYWATLIVLTFFAVVGSLLGSLLTGS